MATPDTFNPIRTAITSNKATAEFDLFKVMGIRNKELIHSRMLAAFFDPKQDHGLGANLLNAFVASLYDERRTRLFCGEKLQAAQLFAARLPEVDFKIRREWKHIDLVLLFPTAQLVIGIENKLGAHEQPKQIERYQETLQSHFPEYTHAIVFLTTTGRSPKTANRESDVPVYCMSYSTVSTLLKEQRPNATPHAAIAFDLFINNVDRYLAGRTYSTEQKISEAFTELRCRLIEKHDVEIRSTPKESRRKPNFYDLDFRVRTWPNGVWIKIYKHNWFGAFPYIHDVDLKDLAGSTRLPVSTRCIKNWPGYYYVSSNEKLDKGRKIRSAGNRLDKNDIQRALDMVECYIREINMACLEGHTAVSPMPHSFPPHSPAFVG